MRTFNTFIKDKSKIVIHLTMYFLDWFTQEEGPHQEVLTEAYQIEITVPGAPNNCSLIIVANSSKRKLTI